MAKEDLKNLLTESKKELDQDRLNFERAVKDELKSFKKKTLGKV